MPGGAIVFSGENEMTLPKDPIKAAEYCEKIRQSRIGTKASEVTKHKMHLAQTGKRNHNYGKPMSIEQKRKISKTKTGVAVPSRTRKKMSETHLKRYEDHPEIKDALRIAMIGQNNPNYGKPISPEQKIKLSAAKKGERHPNFGKHLPESTCEKIRIANSGPNCYHYGQSPSLETRMKMSESQKGDKCYNWKGGITALNHAIRTCLQNREWILSVFKRDNFTCQKCGATKVYLHAHHIRLFADILREHNISTLEEAVACAELWDLNNGISYCEECHKVEHFGVAGED
jgi:hypothetical protein